MRRKYMLGPERNDRLDFCQSSKYPRNVARTVTTKELGWRKDFRLTFVIDSRKRTCVKR
jgi:hypothetical protein